MPNVCSFHFALRIPHSAFRIPHSTLRLKPVRLRAIINQIKRFRRKEQGKLDDRDLSVYRERAILVGVYFSPQEARDTDLLDELGRLADTAGALVVGRAEQLRRARDPATCIGKGKVAELAEEIQRLDADVVLFDVELTPSQIRNLEKALDTKVVDRTELILDIFARHARTSAAQLQVELAQLEYTYPRLQHMWRHLEKIEGGIGTRGPGERQIESDRRMVRKRIEILKDRIREIESRRAQEVRSRIDVTKIGLVGYTNAGKSSLMNVLTDANVKVEDALFVTLDTRTRKWELGGGRKALLSDTVGFIRKLPHDLVSSFYATLEEVRHADLLLHVIDVSSPFAREQADTVTRVLEEIGCKDSPRILVLNKCDLLKDESIAPLFRRGHEEAVLVSARTGLRLETLRNKVVEFMDRSVTPVRVAFGVANGKLHAWLVTHARVLEKSYDDSTATFRVLLRPAEVEVVQKLGGKIMGELQVSNDE